MKYIDADKLKGFVEELKKRAQRNCYDSWGIVPDALEEVEGFITSLQQEQPEVDLEREINAWLDSGTYTIRETARHFAEWGMSVMRERITNPDYNQKVIEKMKSEYPMDKVNTRKKD